MICYDMTYQLRDSRLKLHQTPYHTGGLAALPPLLETDKFSLSVCVQSCSKADVARISDPVAATSYLEKTNNSPQIDEEEKIESGFPIGTAPI